MSTAVPSTPVLQKPTHHKATKKKPPQSGGYALPATLSAAASRRPTPAPSSSTPSDFPRFGANRSAAPTAVTAYNSMTGVVTASDLSASTVDSGTPKFFEGQATPKASKGAAGWNSHDAVCKSLDMRQ